MRWIGEPRSESDGVVERRFDIDVQERIVPGLLWTPSEPGAHPRPLVLMAHGATHDKRAEYLVALAQVVVRRFGFAAASIDAPGHGERRTDGVHDEIQLFSEFVTEWSRPGSTDEVVADWAATVAELRALDEIGDGPIGFWGLSMGTIYGIPFVASEARVQAAIFGLMGLVGPTRDRLETDARSLSCPVMFIQQWDDRLMPREHVFGLFEALGSLDKRLHAHPGEHAAVPEEELHHAVAFFERHLAAKHA